MSAPPPEEQRGSPRLARHFMARFRPAYEPHAEWLVSPLHDLSSSGARFLSERPLEVDAPLALQITLPAVANPVGLKARVAWVKPWHMPGVFEVGVAFGDAELGARQIIGEAVRRFLEREARKDPR